MKQNNRSSINIYSNGFKEIKELYVCKGILIKYGIKNDNGNKNSKSEDTNIFKIKEELDLYKNLGDGLQNWNFLLLLEGNELFICIDKKFNVIITPDFSICVDFIRHENFYLLLTKFIMNYFNSNPKDFKNFKQDNFIDYRNINKFISDSKKNRENIIKLIKKFRLKSFDKLNGLIIKKKRDEEMKKYKNIQAERVRAKEKEKKKEEEDNLNKNNQNRRIEDNVSEKRLEIFEITEEEDSKYSKERKSEKRKNIKSQKKYTNVLNINTKSSDLVQAETQQTEDNKISESRSIVNIQINNNIKNINYNSKMSNDKIFDFKELFALPQNEEILGKQKDKESNESDDKIDKKTRKKVNIPGYKPPKSIEDYKNKVEEYKKRVFTTGKGEEEPKEVEEYTITRYNFLNYAYFPKEKSFFEDKYREHIVQKTYDRIWMVCPVCLFLMLHESLLAHTAQFHPEFYNTDCLFHYPKADFEKRATEHFKRRMNQEVDKLQRVFDEIKYNYYQINQFQIDNEIIKDISQKLNEKVLGFKIPEDSNKELIMKHYNKKPQGVINRFAKVENDKKDDEKVDEKLLGKKTFRKKKFIKDKKKKEEKNENMIEKINNLKKGKKIKLMKNENQINL